MKEYVICFYQDIHNKDGSILFSKGNFTLVDEKEMFQWVEMAHNNDYSISIYSVANGCDLSED